MSGLSQASLVKECQQSFVAIELSVLDPLLLAEVSASKWLSEFDSFCTALVAQRSLGCPTRIDTEVRVSAASMVSEFLKDIAVYRHPLLQFGGKRSVESHKPDQRRHRDL